MSLLPHTQVPLSCSVPVVLPLPLAVDNATIRSIRSGDHQQDDDEAHARDRTGRIGANCAYEPWLNIMCVAGSLMR